MMSYFLTVFYTHVFPAPIGKGKMPPTENWAAGLVADFYGVTIMPVHRACVLNSDSSTVAIKVNGDRRESIGKCCNSTILSNGVVTLRYGLAQYAKQRTI